MSQPVRLRLWPYLRASLRDLCALCAWLAVASIPAAVGGRVIAFAIDAAIHERGAAALGWMMALAASGAVGAWGALRSARSQAEVAGDVRTALTRDVVAGALATATQDLLRARLGGAEVTELLSKLNVVLGRVLRLLPAAVAALGAVVGMATVSPVLLGLVAPFAIGSTVVVWLRARIMHRLSRASLVAAEHRQAIAASVLEGVRDIVATGAHAQVVADVDHAAIAARQAEIRAADADAAFGAVSSFVGTAAPLVVTLAALPALMQSGALTIGDAVGAVTYVVSGLTLGASFMSSVVRDVVSVRVILTRLSEHMTELPLAGKARPGAAREADLVCRGVRFAYGATAVPIIRDFDLIVPLGDHLAIVGPSGSGKSTLAWLLAGLLRPQEGAITLDAVPVPDHPDRAGMIACVPQEAYVFAGTLRDNLTYLRSDATDAEIQHAVTAVGLDRVVARLEGLDGEVDPQRSGLSEGERQLIALTRTYLSPARIVILDEATCYLDPVAEQHAEQAFMARGGTLIVIAHRMSSSLRARRVLVIDGTDPVVGTHHELLAASELYADLHGLWSAAAVTG